MSEEKASKPKRKQLTAAQREEKTRRERERRAEVKRKLLEKKNSPTYAARSVQAKLIAAKMIETPSLSVSGAAKQLGITSVAVHPALVTKSVEWNDLLDEMLPRAELLETHRGLLKASRIEHLTFTRDGEPSDEEIILMLKEVNCVVRKIVHGEQARHVYFFAADNRARKEGLEMAYKLRGDFAADKAAVAFSLAALASARDGSLLPNAADDATIRIEPPAARAPQLPPAVD